MLQGCFEFPWAWYNYTITDTSSSYLNGRILKLRVLLYSSGSVVAASFRRQSKQCLASSLALQLDDVWWTTKLRPRRFAINRQCQWLASIQYHTRRKFFIDATTEGRADMMEIICQASSSPVFLLGCRKWASRQISPATEQLWKYCSMPTSRDPELAVYWSLLACSTIHNHLGSRSMRDCLSDQASTTSEQNNQNQGGWEFVELAAELEIVMFLSEAKWLWLWRGVSDLVSQDISSLSTTIVYRSVDRLAMYAHSYGRPDEVVVVAVDWAYVWPLLCSKQRRKNDEWNISSGNPEGII